MAAKRLGKVSATRGANAPVVSYERKSELLGLFLMALAFAVVLALISYRPADNFLVSSQTFWDAFRQEGSQVQNALGLAGAYIAYYLIPNFLGLPVLVWPVLVFGWGYLFLRNRHSLYLPMYTTFGILGSFEVACFFGWIGRTFNVNLSTMSGSVGMGVADFSIRALGTLGSLFAIVVLMLITALLMIDRDVQQTMERIEEFFQDIVDVVKGFFAFVVENIKGDATEEKSAAKKEKKKKKAEALPQASNGAADEKLIAETSEPAPLKLDGLKKKPRQPVSHGNISDELAPVETAERVGVDSLAGNSTPESKARRNQEFFEQIKHLRTNPSAEPEEPVQPPAFNPIEEEPLPETTTQGPSSSRKISALDPSAIEDIIQGNDEPAQGELELKVQEQVHEERTDKIANSAANVPLREIRFRYPSVELLDASDDQIAIDYAELEENKQILLDKLATYNIDIVDINAIVGPTITMYELTPAPGIKISKIKALEDDLAMAMAARGIRIVAPIPGKTAIGVEIPNRHRELVRLRDLIATKKFRDNKMRLPFPLGKTIEGHVYIQDIASMPHLLIAGATGAGKSVCLNALITGLLYACHPSNLKFVMIDPKKIELQQYGRIVDHYVAIPETYEMPIVTDVSQALGVLKSCEREMEFRYTLLQKAMVRGLHEYNLKFRNGDLSPDAGHRHLPYLVVVVDELADLMLTAGKEIEAPIARLAQMARAVGIHLILATQRPSVDVITGLIKANFPSRIAFQVASKIDSRTILDQNGAEGLVGNGDMLYMKGSQVVRLQGPFVSVDEVDCITEFIAEQEGTGPYFLPSVEEEVKMTVEGHDASDFDDLFVEAARIVVRSQQGSVSLLQRKLAIGYTRSARIVDQLERAGIVGPFEGSKARQVLVPSEAELEEALNLR